MGSCAFTLVMHTTAVTACCAFCYACIGKEARGSAACAAKKLIEPALPAPLVGCQCIQEGAVSVWMPRSCVFALVWMPRSCVFALVWMPRSCVFALVWMPRSCVFALVWMPRSCVFVLEGSRPSSRRQLKNRPSVDFSVERRTKINRQQNTGFPASHRKCL
jgi:hypothetical protein